MTSRVLISAVVHKAPARRTSKAGKPYVVATARDGAGPDAKWWTILGFAEDVIEALAPLVEGEAIAVSGAFEATVWAPEGREPRINWTIYADAILSAHKPKKEKKPKRSPAPRAATGQAVASGPSLLFAPLNQEGAAFDDDIPF